jgi:hypothetical protein
LASSVERQERELCGTIELGERLAELDRVMAQSPHPQDALGALAMVEREVDRARRAAGLGSSFPVAGYDDLTAAQVAERLDGLSTAELRQVREHERRNANRKSVLTAIERKLG